MENKPDDRDVHELPASATEFIRQIVRRMGYRRKARQEVQAELTAHFEDELRGVTDPTEREQKARQLIEQFGDPKLLAILCRRAKIRCRSLWAKTMVRTLQAATAFLLLFGFYLIWFVSGRPVVKVDYLAQLNRMSRPEIVESDNAWPHYEKAIALAVEPNSELAETAAFKNPRDPNHWDLAGLSAGTQAAIETWVQTNQPAWEALAMAGSKPYLYKPYEYPGNSRGPLLMNVRTADLRSLRDLGHVGVWRSRVHVEQGRTAEALEDCLIVAQAGRHWQRTQTLTEQYVGLAFADMAHQEILRVAQRPDLTAGLLADLQRQVAGLYPGPYPRVEMPFERLVFLDLVQHVFTDDGPGGGHLIPSQVAGMSAIMEGDHKELAEFPLLRTALSLIHARRDDTVAMACGILDRQKELSGLSPYERRERQVPTDGDLLGSLPKFRYALLDFMLPVLDRAAEFGFRAKALHEATLTILALRRYHLEKGQYPASLDELMQAGYLGSLPADPYSDGSLTYQVADDAFTLYSVGPNFNDDGGKMSTDHNRRPRMWGDDGDAVFWPVGP